MAAKGGDEGEGGAREGEGGDGTDGAREREEEEEEEEGGEKGAKEGGEVAADDHDAAAADDDDDEEEEEEENKNHLALFEFFDWLHYLTTVIISDEPFDPFKDMCEKAQWALDAANMAGNKDEIAAAEGKLAAAEKMQVRVYILEYYSVYQPVGITYLAKYVHK